MAHLPRESATVRATQPNAGHTDELELLRQIEHDLRVLAWQKTKDGQDGRNLPVPYRFDWEPRDTVWEHDVLDWDEAAEKLGGDPRLAAVMARL